MAPGPPGGIHPFDDEHVGNSNGLREALGEVPEEHRVTTWWRNRQPFETVG